MNVIQHLQWGVEYTNEQMKVKFYLLVNASLSGQKKLSGQICFVSVLNALGFLSLLFAVHPALHLLFESFLSILLSDSSTRAWYLFQK